MLGPLPYSYSIYATTACSGNSLADGSTTPLEAYNAAVVWATPGGSLALADMPGTGGGYYGGGGGGKRKGWLAPKYVLQLLPGEAVLQVRVALAHRSMCSSFLPGEAGLHSALLLQA